MDADPYLSILTQIYCAVVPACNTVTVNPPELGSIIAIIVAIFALCISAFISGSETAYFSLTPTDIEDIENEKTKNDIKEILSKPQRLLATILITNNLVNVAIVILLNFALQQIFEFQSGVLDFVVKSVVLTFILLLFGEILPKLYSNNHSITWVKFAVGGIKFFLKLFGPAAKLIVKSTSVVNKIVTKKSEDLSLDDLSYALEITDVKEGKEKNMLKEILKFGGKDVSEIMTPRVDMTDVNWDCSFGKLLQIVRDSGYSRMPVYIGNEDNIKGIIYAKDLLPYIGKMDDNFKWQSLLRVPLFVPETRMIDDMLEDFRTKKVHMAIVVDEYGGTQGIVTLEDVLEEIVGEINDEYDVDEAFYTKVSSDTYVFEGKTQLNDFYRVTGLEENEFEAVGEDAETIAGLLLNIKQDFPSNKEILEYGRCRFLILDVEKHRINKVKVKILDASVVSDKGENDK